MRSNSFHEHTTNQQCLSEHIFAYVYTSLASEYCYFEDRISVASYDN
jgi:hypothetical protein